MEEETERVLYSELVRAWRRKDSASQWAGTTKLLINASHHNYSPQYVSLSFARVLAKAVAGGIVVSAESAVCNYVKYALDADMDIGLQPQDFLACLIELVTPETHGFKLSVLDNSLRLFVKKLLVFDQIFTHCSASENLLEAISQWSLVLTSAIMWACKWAAHCLTYGAENAQESAKSMALFWELLSFLDENCISDDKMIVLLGRSGFGSHPNVSLYDAPPSSSFSDTINALNNLLRIGRGTFSVSIQQKWIRFEQDVCILSKILCFGKIPLCALVKGRRYSSLRDSQAFCDFDLFESDEDPRYPVTIIFEIDKAKKYTTDLDHLARLLDFIRNLFSLSHSEVFRSILMISLELIFSSEERSTSSTAYFSDDLFLQLQYICGRVPSLLKAYLKLKLEPPVIQVNIPDQLTAESADDLTDIELSLLYISKFPALCERSLSKTSGVTILQSFCESLADVGLCRIPVLSTLSSSFRFDAPKVPSPDFARMVQLIKEKQKPPLNMFLNLLLKSPSGSVDPNAEFSGFKVPATLLHEVIPLVSDPCFWNLRPARSAADANVGPPDASGLQLVLQHFATETAIELLYLHGLSEIVTKHIVQFCSYFSARSIPDYFRTQVPAASMETEAVEADLGHLMHAFSSALFILVYMHQTYDMLLLQFPLEIQKLILAATRSQDLQNAMAPGTREANNGTVAGPIHQQLYTDVFGNKAPPGMTWKEFFYRCCRKYPPSDVLISAGFVIVPSLCKQTNTSQQLLDVFQETVRAVPYIAPAIIIPICQSMEFEFNPPAGVANTMGSLGNIASPAGPGSQEPATAAKIQARLNMLNKLMDFATKELPGRLVIEVVTHHLLKACCQAPSFPAIRQASFLQAKHRPLVLTRDKDRAAMAKLQFQSLLEFAAQSGMMSHVLYSNSIVAASASVAAAPFAVPALALKFFRKSTFMTLYACGKDLGAPAFSRILVETLFETLELIRPSSSSSSKYAKLVASASARDQKRRARLRTRQKDRLATICFLSASVLYGVFGDESIVSFVESNFEPLFKEICFASGGTSKSDPYPSERLNRSLAFFTVFLLTLCKADSEEQQGLLAKALSKIWDTISAHLNQIITSTADASDSVVIKSATTFPEIFTALSLLFPSNSPVYIAAKARRQQLIQFTSIDIGSIQDLVPGLFELSSPQECGDLLNFYCDRLQSVKADSKLYDPKLVSSQNHVFESPETIEKFMVEEELLNPWI